MTICKYVYLDVDGKPSPVYYETFKKSGHEAALKAYVEYMLSTNAKFSTDAMGRVMTIDELIEKSAKLKITSDEQQYLNQGTGNLHNRITNLVQQIKTEPDTDKGFRIAKKEFDVEGISMDLAKRELQFRATYDKGYLDRKVQPDQKTIDAIYEEYMADKDPGLLEEVARLDFKDRWEASAKWGDYFHATMQQFFIEYNKQVIDERAKPGNEAHFVSNAKLLSDARKTLAKDKNFKHMVSLQVDTNMPAILDKVVTHIKTVIEQERIRYGETPSFRFLPELKLSSDNVPGKPAGTSDLVLVTNNGNAYIFDFKTKSEESMLNMNRVGKGKFGGAFEGENLSDTPANSARVQMAYYAAILEEDGFKVQQTYTIMMPGAMARVSSKDTKGEREWIFTGINPNELKIIGLPNIHHLLQEDTDATKAAVDLARSNGVEKWVLDLASTDEYINLLYTRDNSKNYILRKKAELNSNDKGEKYFNRDNPMLGKEQRKFFVGNKTDAEIDKVLLADYQQIKEEQKHLANNIIQYFNVNGADKQHSLGGRTKIVAALLGDVNKETHTLTRADRYHPALADIGADVLIAENKLTGAISLFSVMPVLNAGIKFSTGKTDKRTTVFGKYANDAAVTALRPGSEVLEQNYMHDFASMKLGLAAIKLKSLTDKPLLIEDMRVASIVSSDAASITTTYMAKELAKLAMIRKFAPKEDVPKFISDLLDKPSNVTPTAYGFAYIDHLKKLILQKHGAFANKGIIEIGRIVEEKLNSAKNGDLVSYATLSAVAQYRKEVHSMLEGLHPGTNVLKMPEMLAIDHAIVQMNRYNINSKQLIRNRVSKVLGRTAMGTLDVLAERSQTIMNTASENVRKDFKQFYTKHDALLREFVLENDGSKKAFALIMADSKFTQGNEKNWMKLKDVSDPTLRNSPAARAYIEFFNSSVEQFYTKLLPSNKIEAFKSGDTWSKGLVPIVRAAKGMFDEKSYTSVSNWTDALKQNVKSMQKANYDPQLANDFEFTGADKFTAQLGNEGPQHSRARSEALGMSENSKNAVPSRNVETNLAAVLVNLAVTTSEAEHMGNVLIIHDALYNVIEHRKGSAKDIEADATVDYLKEWTNMVVHNKYGKEESEPITRYADQIGKMASTLYFSASTKQAMTELFTGTFQITSAMIANSLTGLVSKGKTVHFYPKDVMWAAKNLDGAIDVNMQSKGFQIMFDLGMTYADSAQLKQKEFYDTGRGKIFKSRPMFYLNQLFFTSSITLSALAEVHHLGIDKAYVNVGTEQKPEWKYDETMDDRFYVYDPENKSLGSKKKTEAPKTPDEKKKYALWKAVRTELDAEGMINEEGAMVLPLTANELTSMKFYATKLYGSFNKDKTNMAEKSVVGRSMLRYKGWFLQKAANYWTPTDMSISRGKFEWVEDPELEDGGYQKWTGIPHEGILESVGSLMKEIAKFEGIPHPTDIQLENLGKLFGDLLLFLALLGPLLAYLTASDSEFMKSLTGKAMLGAFNNASSDLAIWKATSTMGDTVFPGISMALQTAGSAITAATSIMTGDQDLALKSFLKVPATVGAYNTFSSAAELIGSVKPS